MAIVDLLHGDGRLPQLPVRMTSSTVEAASYAWDERTGSPLALSVSRHAPRPHLSVLHELGHFLDQQALGGDLTFASETDLVPEVMRAIEETAAIRQLHALRRKRQLLIHMPWGRRERFTLDQRLLAYLLEPREQFARAYAQYVATTNADTTLLAQLEAVRRDIYTGLVYHQQWDDDDFMPVLRAFDQLLRQRRWIE